MERASRFALGLLTLLLAISAAPLRSGAQVCDRLAPIFLGATPRNQFFPAELVGAVGVPMEFEVNAIDPDGEAITSLTASFINLPAGHDATFTPSVDNRTGIVRWTPQPGQAGNYTIGFLVSNARAGSGSVQVEVVDSGGDPFIGGQSAVFYNNGLLVSFPITAGDPDGEPIVSLTADVSDFPAENQPTVTVSADYRSAVVTWLPTLGAADYDLVLTATSSTTVTKTIPFLRMTDTFGPTLYSPQCAVVEAGTTLLLPVAVDPIDGPVGVLTADLSGLPAGASASFTPSPDNRSGVVTWNTLPGDVSTTPYTITVHAGYNVPTLSRTTPIYVDNDAVNQLPIADTGLSGRGAPLSVPLCFDGTNSWDPDGVIVSHLWDFGDGTQGVGATPCHTYTAVGFYTVLLTVSDGAATDTSATYARVIEPYGFFHESGTFKVIRLGSNKPTWCTNLEPFDNLFTVEDIDLSTVRFKRFGGTTEIPAIVGKGATVGDYDKDGIPDISICFSKDDLRILFADVNGTQRINCEMTGYLISAGVNFRATNSVDVSSGGGGPLVSAMRPNPLNPSGTVTLSLERGGAVDVSVYDIQGRLVRRLWSERAATRGTHEIEFDGRDGRGAPLASGVYLVRVEAEGVTQSGRFTILR
ncbi:MAG TPA: PKD domain-containing protein [Candidatus Eisenbacteria bacterium]|nr:PKD domain-containing protein [Candidatus Eisenbacteria bacterium]